MLEQQFASGKSTADSPTMLLPSHGFLYSYDTRRPAGDRVVDVRLDGRPIDPNRSYRVAVGSFLATGGDNFTVLKQAADATDIGLDLDSTEAWLKTNPKPPELGRMKNLGPPPTP